MKKLAKILLVVMLVAAFALVLTACTKTDCEQGKHDFTGKETVVTEAKCETAGKKTVQCKNCDETQEVEIPALGHDYSGAWTVVSGKHSQKCSRCDSTTTHDANMGAWAVVEGKHVQTCTKCTIKGEHEPEFDDTIEANVTVTKDSTCIEKGSKTITCKHCSLTTTEEIGLKEHDFDETTYICKTEGCNTVGPNAPVKIGTTYYVTVADAIAAAQAGDTVVLQKDIVIDAQIIVAKNIVLDLNGKTISNTTDLWVKGSDTVKTVNSMLQVESGANVVITGNGKILAKENDCYTFNVVDGTLVIESGEFRGNISAVQVQKGTATIKGGKFSIAQHSTLAWAGPYDFMLNCIDDPYKEGIANIVVEGGEFVNFDPANNKAEGADTSWVAEGLKSVSKTESSDTIYSVAFDAKFETVDFDKLIKDTKVSVIGIVSAVNTKYPYTVEIANLNGDTLAVTAPCDETGKSIAQKDLEKVFEIGKVIVMHGTVSEFSGKLQIASGWLIQIGNEAKTTLNELTLNTIVLPVEISTELALPQIEGLTWTVKEGAEIVAINNGTTAVITQPTQDSSIVLVAKLGEATREITVAVVGNVEGRVLKLTAYAMNMDSSSYANNNGDHEVGDYTVNTNQVYKNSSSANLQCQKNKAVIKVTGQFTKIVINLASNNAGGFSLTVNGKEITATETDTTVTFEFTMEEAAEIVLKETNKGTGYVTSIEFFNETASSVE